jgi:DUF1680 family protein
MLAKKICLLLVLKTLSAGSMVSLHAQTGSADPFTRVKHLEPVWESLPLNSVRPEGWLRKEMERNLSGFTGHLDSLVPDLILQDDIYGKDRLSKHVRSKNVGAVGEEGAWQVQYLWWNSETQSNWLDGYMRTAVLLNDTKHLEKVGAMIDRLLSTQDADGYIGIYDPELRYRFDNENGELWAKASLYRVLLGWYAYRKDQRILSAVEKAVGNVMQAYPVNRSHPFFSKNPNAGGLTHGLVFTDVLEQLYQLTGKRTYLDYILFLYKDFSAQVLNEDAQWAKLVDIAQPLKGHGVHTYEHFRSVIAAYYASGNPKMKTAMGRFEEKILRVTTPSGGPVSDEFILGRSADASLGYEFCSLHELMAGWISLLEKTGRGVYADRAERILFNAVLGSTHPEESAICYLKQDDAFFLTGGNNGDSSDKHQTRYRYSPIHREAAVCCVPNAGRVFPYFVQHMWMKDGDGLVASLLGPCEVRTVIQNRSVSVKVSTDYPFDNRMRFTVEADGPATFPLKVRKPVGRVAVSASIPYKEEDGFLVFRQRWDKQTVFDLSFEFQPERKTAAGGASYFQYGPLVLCRPLPAEQKVTREFNLAGLRESVYIPLSRTDYRYAQAPLVRVSQDKLLFRTQMVRSATGNTDTVDLVPMAGTILRQVTFKSVQ